MQTLKQQNSDFVVFELFFFLPSLDIYTAFLSTFIWKEFPQDEKTIRRKFPDILSN